MKHPSDILLKGLHKDLVLQAQGRTGQVECQSCGHPFNYPESDCYKCGCWVPGKPVAESADDQLDMVERMASRRAFGRRLQDGFCGGRYE